MDHNNLSGEQLNSSFQSSNSSNINGNNSMNTGLQPTESINELENETKHGIIASSSNASSLPNSSTTSTISTSSSNSTFTTSTVNNGTDDVCRDFLRNVCRRGKSCRFKHPDQNDIDVSGRNFVFCHDYQNRECRRENCRFLHCSKQEEEIFRMTGKLPQHVQGQMANDDGKNNATPICKDFINGICRRAPGRCKFRHPPGDSFQQTSSPPNRNSYDGRNGQRNTNFAMCSPNNSHNLDYQTHYGRQHGPPLGASPAIMPSTYGGYGDAYADSPNKRKRPFDSIYSNNNNGPYNQAYNDPMANQVHGYPMHSSNQPYYGNRNQMDTRYLEEENTALRRRIDELKKQVTELITTNDFLMEQINQFRVQNAAGAPAAAVAVATATSVASLAPQAPPPGVVSSTATAVGISTPLSQSLSLQAPVGPPPPPPPTAAVMGALQPPPSSIVSSIASISLPTVTAPVSLVNSSAAASLVSYTPSLHSSNPWPLGVDQ